MILLMIIQTQYHYEKRFRDTQEKDLLRIIQEEIGDADPAGTLLYIKESVKSGENISVGSCKFRMKPKEN